VALPICTFDSGILSDRWFLGLAAAGHRSCARASTHSRDATGSNSICIEFVLQIGRMAYHSATRALGTLDLVSSFHRNELAILL
jgi:hypothetical protein